MEDAQLDDAIDLLPDNEASNEEKQILKGIRKFGNTTVKQTMRTRLDVSGIETRTSFKSLINKIQEMSYSRLPVYKGNLDEIVGMLHTKDILPYLSEEENFDWHSLMRPVFYVHEQKLIEDLLQDFRNRRMHIAVVVDEFGGTSGIITLEDIMEEIIGDIQDEFDDEMSVNKKLDEFNYVFEGKTMIQDVCKALNIPTHTFDLLRGESDSLAGLVLEIAGEFPEVNDEFVTQNYIFTPLEIDKNRIQKIKITLKPKTVS
jgi:CBS domain containing-hemolysin-like protein